MEIINFNFNSNIAYKPVFSLKIADTDNPIGSRPV